VCIKRSDKQHVKMKIAHVKSINDKLIVILLEDSTLRWATLYICSKCPDRSYLARCTVILITSRDSAILLLYRCLRHSHTEYELRTIFHHFNSLKSDRNLSVCTFWKFSYKRKIFFLTHILYAKSTFNSDRKLYKKKWCDQMRIWSSSHWKTDSLFDSQRWLSRKRW
jgi:hypothetical protein